MRKNLQPAYLYVLAAIVFFVVAVLSERPGIYNGLGAACLVLGFAAKKKSREKVAGEP